MADETALHDQALAASADLLAEMSDALPIRLHRMVRAALAVAWIEGRQAGGEEAKAVVRAFIEASS